MNSLKLSTPDIFECYNFSIFFMSVMILCGIVLITSYILGGKSYGRFKNVPFESGIVSVGGTNLKFSVHFYLIGMFFLIFDVESVYLYSWSINIVKLGWLVFLGILFFVFSLLVGLLYLVRTGALNWVHKQ